MSGYVDLQVNGYAGVDFNADDLTLEALHRACERMRADGVAGALATIITANLEQMTTRLARLARWREDDSFIADMLWGWHIEGPFISPQPGFVGAHPPQHVMPANWDAMQRLLDAGAGLTRLVTLAPEHDAGFRVIARLAQQGIAVSAGHTDASRETLAGAIDQGLSMFTHLGNGCPPILARHDNIIQRALSLASRLWIMVIADGAHVPFFALGNYLRQLGTDRVIGVTDAIAAAGMGPGRFTIGGVTAEVGADLVPRCPGNPAQLAGSGLTMPVAAKNLREQLRLDEASIARMLSDNPRLAISFDRHVRGGGT
jgi:N-acetylglucosamine-6-phosphate deacetylase